MCTIAVNEGGIAGPRRKATGRKAPHGKNRKRRRLRKSVEERLYEAKPPSVLKDTLCGNAT
ncbi:MAG: hypothetical protein R6U27_14630 [Desulfobacterales bacterium]